jgi:hypothetical protein
MRREVVERLQLTQPGFAVNAEIGLQPVLMGCKLQEVPISWINRTPDMGMSSFRLVRVGGAYWQVLWGLWLKIVWGRGPYRDLVYVGTGRVADLHFTRMSAMQLTASEGEPHGTYTRDVSLRS